MEPWQVTLVLFSTPVLMVSTLVAVVVLWSLRADPAGRRHALRVLAALDRFARRRR